MTGLCFDIDDTLYSRRELLLRAARDTLGDRAALYGKPGMPEEDRFMEVFYFYSDESLPRVLAGEMTPYESNVERYMNTIRHLGGKADREDGIAFADRYTYLLNHITLSGELEVTLQKLSSCDQLRLGVLTNGLRERQMKKFDMLGLARYIDRNYVLTTGEIGVSKPERGAFDAIRERFGLAPENMWMIGDSLRTDIEGAKACGWHTFWLCRDGRVPDDARTARADLIAQSEEEMCRMLCGLADCRVYIIPDMIGEQRKRRNCVRHDAYRVKHAVRRAHKTYGNRRNTS